MKMIKNADRGLKGATMRKVFREIGCEIKDLGTYCKWVEMVHGRRQSSLTVYRIDGTKPMGKIVYMLCDSLDRVANELAEDRDDVFKYLKDHGWKPEKKWYLEDCGMSEELWNVWNGNGEEEE